MINFINDVVLFQCTMFSSGGISKKSAKIPNMSSNGSRSKSSKEIHIDEVVKIAMNLSLERFHYSDEKGTRCF